jgi:hypothetical protein
MGSELGRQRCCRALPIIFLFALLTSGADRPLHLTADECRLLDAAAGKGAHWLASRQGEGGDFRPAVSSQACPLALTAIALWALCETEKSTLDVAGALRAGEFLYRHRQADGGIYDPERGLTVYSSAVSARALRAFAKRHQASQAEAVLSELELFVYRRGAPESLTDAAQKSGLPLKRIAQEARSLLLTAKRDELGADQRRALEFLAQLASDGQARLPYRVRFPRRSGTAFGEPFGYDDLLPLVYQPVKSTHTLALRARQAIQSFYTLEENPDLTRRYGEAGFRGGTQGLYYYYLAVAVTLSAFKAPTLKVQGGETHDWVRELSRKILSLQREDGSWVNGDGQWWEDEPVLVTSYALLSLALCRQMERPRT